jgi:hypothetical protein
MEGRKLVSIGKETDRSWEQGDDPSVPDFKMKEYDEESKMGIADLRERKRWAIAWTAPLNARVRLSQKAVYAIIDGEPVRRDTLVNFMLTVDG